MAGLPALSGRKLIKVLAKIGYREVRQRGSHVRLERVGKKSLTVPDHATIGKALLSKILRDIKISTKDFLKLL